mgnify:CR=1 FL=1
MSSMVNLRNGQNKNPIDIAKELATSYQDGLDEHGFELLKRFYKDLYKDLIKELEKQYGFDKPPLQRFFEMLKNVYNPVVSFNQF